MTQELPARIASLEHLLDEARAERDDIQRKLDDYVRNHAIEHSEMEGQRAAAIVMAQEADELRAQAVSDAYAARLANRQHVAVRAWLRGQLIAGMSSEQATEIDTLINTIAVEASHVEPRDPPSN